MEDLSGALNTISTFTSPKSDFKRILLKTQKPKLTITTGTQSKLERRSTEPPVVKRRLPHLLVLGNPPPKPDRPPGVDIHRFQRNRKSLKDESRVMLHHVASSSTSSPPRLQPPLNLAAILKEQAERFKKHQERHSGTKEVNHGGEPEKKWAETKKSRSSEEMKRQTETKEKKHLKKQEVKEQRHQDTMTLLKDKGPGHRVKRQKAPLDFEGARSDFFLDKRGIVHNTDPREEEEPYLHDTGVYYNIGAPVERVGLQQIMFGDDVYDDVNSQDPPLPFNRLDIYDDINEDCLYELD